MELLADDVQQKQIVLKAEMETCMRLLGVKNVSELSPRHVSSICFPDSNALFIDPFSPLDQLQSGGKRYLRWRRRFGDVRALGQGYV